VRARIGALIAVIISSLAFATLATPNTSQASSPAALPAQNSAPWTEPVNLSTSGGAIDPIVAVAHSNQYLALWWDQIDGARFSRGAISNTRALWSAPVALPAINGGFDRSNINRPIALPPVEPRLEFGANGVGYLTYKTALSELYLSTYVNGAFGPPAVLGRSVLAVNSHIDVSNTLALAYVLTDTRVQPAGLYFAKRGSAPVLSVITTSLYFRTARAEDVQVSLAGDGKGTQIVTWIQSRDDQARYARSTDGGRTWSAPQPIVPRTAQLGLAARVSVGVIPNGEFMMLWRDASAPGCGFTQSRSNDAGATWTNPERVLGDVGACPADWRLTPNGKDLWLVGTPPRSVGADASIVLARWDGQAWASADADFGSVDPLTRRSRTLACLRASLGLDQLVLIGCDARRDVFAAVNALPLADVLPAFASAWSSRGTIALPPGEISAIETAIGRTGAAYGLVGQISTVGGVPNLLSLTQEQQSAWGASSSALQAVNATTGRDQPVAVTLRDPAFVVDSDRMHVVWRGGASGGVFYSRAFLREAASRDGWTAPVLLPAPGPVGGAPALVSDPRDDALHALVPVGYNEGRGVYLVSSFDGGATWAAPVTVFDAKAAGWSAVDEARLIIDPRANTLHAFWQRVNSFDRNAPRELHYARSDDNGATWTTAVRLADGPMRGVRIAQDASGALVVAFARAAPSNVLETPSAAFVLYSRDGGRNWSRADQVPAFGAISGDVALATTDGGALYLGAIGATDNAESQLQVAAWQDSRFGQPETLALRQPASSANALALAVKPQGALHALVRLDVLQPDGRTRPELRTWVRAIDAAKPAALPGAPSRGQVTTPTPQPTATVLVLPTPTPRPVSTAAPAITPVTGPNMQLIYGVAAAVLAILAALVVFTLLRRR
jgi:hypothetical protein